MTEIEAMVGRLRKAWASADRTGMGPFRFVEHVGSVNDDCVCVVVVARNDAEARSMAARAIAE
jgi:hypothetical protein